jgi:putative transposase
LKELAAKRMRFGYRRLTAMLTREGIAANHKRVYRLYREEGLAMRIRHRRRIRWSGVVTSPAAAKPNERWSMDFVSDCVSSGTVIRLLTIVDDCTRECPAIEVDTSLGGLRVRRVLDRIASERGLPEAIVVDNGPEFRGRVLTAWSEERGVRLEFIQPGKPTQNAYIESFNGRLRDECLNANWFTSLTARGASLGTRNKSWCDPQGWFVECADGDEQAERRGEARRHLDRAHGVGGGAGASFL